MASLIAQGGYYSWKVVNGSNTYTNENICSGTLTEVLYTECSIGNVTAKQLDLKLWNVTIDTSSPIVLSYKPSNSNTWVAKGTYLIDTVATSPYSEYTELTAFDAMLKTDVVYMKSGTWTATTDVALVSAIASSIGVSVDTYTNGYFTNYPITIDQAPSIGENGTTCRQILSTIACLRGGNWIIDDTNKLLFVPLFGRFTSATTISYTTSVDYTIGDEVVNFDESDAEPIVGLVFQANGGDSFRAPSNLSDAQWDALVGRILYCDLPFMASQDAVDTLWNDFERLSISYIPYSANTVYAAPNSKLGYIAKIKDTNVYISNRTLNIDSLAYCDLSAETSRQAESYYPYISPQVREARQKADENYAAIAVMPSQIMAEVYTKGETDSRISSSVTLSASSLRTEFTENISTAVGQANAYTDAQTEGVRTYFDFSANGMTIGKSDSPFKATLDNTKLAFTGADGQDAAWISNNQLYINQAVIPGSSGRWVQSTSADDHFQIRWVAN